MMLNYRQILWEWVVAVGQQHYTVNFDSKKKCFFPEKKAEKRLTKVGKKE